MAPDLPGFGESPVGPVFRPSMGLYAYALANFLDARGLEAPILVGHSFGAAVAVQLVLKLPDRSPAMLLLSPPPLGGLETPDFVYPYLESYRYDRRGLRRALRHVTRTRTPPYLDDLVAEAQRMHPLNFSGNARILADWNVRRAAYRYRGPVLVASGNRDTTIPPSSAAATASAFPRGLYKNLGEVGHSPQVEAPDSVRTLLQRLITDADAPG
jgi:pimeloyl-ACP methyl ester carboxylesterase